MSTRPEFAWRLHVQPFVRTKRGRLAPVTPIEAWSEDETDRLARRHSGAGAAAVLAATAGARCEVVAVYGDLPREAIEALWR